MRPRPCHRSDSSHEVTRGPAAPLDVKRTSSYTHYLMQVISTGTNLHLPPRTLFLDGREGDCCYAYFLVCLPGGPAVDTSCNCTGYRRPIRRHLTRRLRLRL